MGGRGMLSEDLPVIPLMITSRYFVGCVDFLGKYVVPRRKGGR